MAKKKSNNFKKFEARMQENENQCAGFRSNTAPRIEDINIPGIVFEHDEDIRQCTDHPNYYVTNYGKIFRRCQDGEIKLCKVTFAIRSSKFKKKYGQVSVDKKNHYIHVLVALTWVLGRTENCQQVHHIDHNPENNCYKNLQWVDPHLHAFLNKDSRVFFMNNRKNSDFKEVTDLVSTAQTVGIDIRDLSQILSGVPDVHSCWADIYYIDRETTLSSYIFAVERKRNAA